jgi:glycosyltransferase involved in cell wall biosynthesis
VFGRALTAMAAQSSGRRERVLFVTRALGFGGTEKHLAELIVRLDRRLEPVVLCFGPDEYSRYLEHRHGVAVTIHPVTAGNARPGYWQAFRRWRPAVVVFVNGRLGLFPWRAYLAARLSGARRVVAIEQLLGESPPIPPPFRGPLGWLRRRLGWHARYMLGMRAVGYLAHVTICVSEAVRRRLIDDYGYPARRTLIVRNPVDLSHFDGAGPRPTGVRSTFGIGPDEGVLVCVANLNPLKRVDVVLEALTILRGASRSCKCFVVGTGQLADELREKARLLGLSGTVFFIGHADDVRPYLDAADVYVTASDREGLPLAVAEAMACRLPCVATDIGGHNELVVHGETGLLVPPGSPGALARAIEHLLAHPEVREAMGRAARRRVEEHFDMERAMARIQATLVG